MPEREGKTVVIIGVAPLSRLSSVNFTDPAMALVVGTAPEGHVVTPVPALKPTPAPQPAIDNHNDDRDD